MCAAIKSHALANLGMLSIEMMSEYLQNVILPWMAKADREKHGNQPQKEDGKEIERLLKQYGLTVISQSTVCRWLKILGFKFEVRKKGYYIDGHEKVGTVQYRWKFIERYLQREAHLH